MDEQAKPKLTRKVIGSVQRALDILNLYDQRVLELGTTEIAQAMDLPKSTAAGLVATLEQNGYLEQNPENRKYRLGFKLAERAGVLLGQFDLRQVAAPVLEALRDDCQESVNLAVLDQNQVVYIERIHGHNMLGMRTEIGKREHAHSTALGKAMLAWLPDEQFYTVISQLDFISHTPYTITNPVTFRLDIERTRKRGYGLDDQENESGGRCVAAPIFNHHGELVAAVSISVPIQRMPDEKIIVFGEQVRAAACEISRRLGAPRNRSEVD